MTARTLAICNLIFGLHCSATHLQAWTSEMMVAQNWLRAHAAQDPDQEGLDELKDANPDAYAIVQALLTKKSLGLLNPRHPSASFATPDKTAPDGSAAVDYLRSTEPNDGSSIAPVSLSSTQSKKDWLNWKPSDNDDAVVADINTGSAVPASTASIASSSPVERTDTQPSTSALSDALASSVEQPAPTAQVQQKAQLGAISLDWGNPFAGSSSAPHVAAASPVVPRPVKEVENSYLKGIDFGSDTIARKPVASMSQENSYLKSTGLAEAKPEHVAPGPNLLTGFSWFSDTPKADTGYLQKSSEDVQKTLQPATAGGALGRWLRH